LVVNGNPLKALPPLRDDIALQIKNILVVVNLLKSDLNNFFNRYQSGDMA